MSRLPGGLYGVADTAFGDPVVLGRTLARGGCRVVQLRAKDWDTHDRTEAARALVENLHPLGVVVVVNDDVQAALTARADGVHLGQDDGDLAHARALLGPGALIGRSTHDLAQVACATAEGADYLGFGPVFTTHTKVGAAPAVGLAGLRSAIAATPLPVVAIGGIDMQSLHSVRATGVHGWAVISALLGAVAEGLDALEAHTHRFA